MISMRVSKTNRRIGALIREARCIRALTSSSSKTTGEISGTPGALTPWPACAA